MSFVHEPSEQLSFNLDPQEIREEVDRILQSERFLKSPQLSRFLRYCVDETLAGRQEALKEQVLGTEVFRRVSPFDPRLDPIVRVEARRLRSKLDRYYECEGATNPLMITFQRGDYIPRFIRPTTSEKPSARSKPVRILIVEDERVVIRDLENRLKSLGYTVAGAASSGEAALEQAEELRPDIILMDIVLAGSMRGTEVARRIWSSWRIPVVYLTGFSDAMVLEDVKDSEPYGYVLKPFDTKQLHAVLQLALGRLDRENANAAGSREFERDAALTSALSSAGVRAWEWIVTDGTLPWPNSVRNSSGATFSDAETAPEQFCERIDPEDRDRIAQAFTRAIQDRTRLEATFRRVTPQTGTEWVIATGSVVEGEDGRLRCTGLEIGATSAVRPEEPAELAKLEQFVRSAGQDLQEPLRTIKSYTEILAARRSSGDPVSKSALGFIQGGVDQMHALVKDLLAYTKLPAGERQQPEAPDVEEPADAPR